jgi:hypothetical protein
MTEWRVAQGGQAAHEGGNQTNVLEWVGMLKQY